MIISALIDCRAAAGLQGFTFREFWSFGSLGFIVNPRKLEHGFSRISAKIPYTLP